MNSSQNKDKIRQLAMDLDYALEKRDYDKVKSFFSGECSIELLGITLHGLNGVKKWLDFIFSYVDSIILTPIVILIEDDVFFEEFLVNATFYDNSTVVSKWAEVLVYQDYKILSLRLYFDRLEFAKNALDGYISKKLIEYIDKKSKQGLI